MVRELPAKHLRPCLQQLMSLVYSLISSYQMMLEFHEANQRSAAPTAAAGAGAAAQDGAADKDGGSGGASASTGDATQRASSDDRSGRSSPGSDGGGGANDQMAQVQAATRALLAAVAEALRGARPEVADAASSKVRELLLAAGMARGDDLVQVGAGGGAWSAGWLGACWVGGGAFLGVGAHQQRQDAGDQTREGNCSAVDD